MRPSEGLRAATAGNRLGRFGALRGRAGAEVVVFEAVAVSPERDQLGVVDEAIDHRRGGGVVAEDLAPGESGLFEVTIRLARS